MSFSHYLIFYLDSVTQISVVVMRSTCIRCGSDETTSLAVVVAAGVQVYGRGALQSEEETGEHRIEVGYEWRRGKEKGGEEGIQWAY